MNFLVDLFTVKKPIGRLNFLGLSLLFTVLWIILILCISSIIKDGVTLIFILMPIAFWCGFCIIFKRLWHVTGSQNNATILTIVLYSAKFVPILKSISPLVLFIICLFVPGQELEDIEDYQPKE